MNTDTPSRRGPDLPYSLIAGVKPCATGWLLASAKVQGTIFSPEEPVVVDTFVEILDYRPSYSVITINAPIGYKEADEGRRACDGEARQLLGRRGAAIHSAPQRAESGDGVNLAEDHLDAVSKTLLPRFLEVAAEMVAYRQRTVYEVHSEMSFYQLNGDTPLSLSKRTELGQLERRTLLEARIPGVDRILDVRIPRVPASHLLDVAAFLWTARRILGRAAQRVPSDPEWDVDGLRMEIVR